MDPIEKCGVIIKCFRERLKEICCAHHVRNAAECIALKSNGRIRANGVRATRKAPVCHIVLHDLNHVAGSMGNAGDLIEGNAVPIAYKAHSAGGHVIEHIRHCRRAAAHQNGVGGQLTIDMGFTGSTRAKLHQVIVFLNERDKAEQIVQLFFFR